MVVTGRLAKITEDRKIQCLEGNIPHNQNLESAKVAKGMCLLTKVKFAVLILKIDVLKLVPDKLVENIHLKLLKKLDWLEKNTGLKLNNWSAIRRLMLFTQTA